MDRDAIPCLHLVDDDPRFRSALARLLRTMGYNVREYECAESFLAAPPGGAGCVLLDIRMPGISGLELQAEMARRGMILPIVFLTGHGDIPMSVQALRAGAEDFLTKPVKRSALQVAVERALEREVRQRAVADARRLREERLSQLSPREREVAQLLSAGLLNKQVAYQLGTTERTVKAHRAKVMDKLGIHSVAELVRLMEDPTRPAS
ncbi:response regulator [Cupriavidus basilensis]|uniref:Response regulator n=1 Tax=Cupriavidus basilensis TaxID=68895 RepID=A0ABT6AR98_9BURK|nr:response regulator [Cupriavidus basilensis]MDF3835148.1 response regulator [Cupriavidus basilensis]